MKTHVVEIWLEYDEEGKSRIDTLREVKIEAKNAGEAVEKIFAKLHCSVLHDGQLGITHPKFL